MRAGFSELVKGRYVLIGGDIIDNDQFNTPLSRFPDAITGQHETMIGLEVHAHMLAQQLDKAWPRPIPGPALWALAVLIVLAGGLPSLIDLREIGRAACRERVCQNGWIRGRAGALKQKTKK